MVISQSQENGWFVTPAGLLFLFLSLKLSRSGATTKTRQLVRGTDICLAQAEQPQAKHKVSAIHGEAKQRRTKRDFNQRTFIHISHKIYRSDLTQRTFSCRSRTTTESFTEVPLPPSFHMNKGGRRYRSQPLLRRSYLKSLNIHPFIVLPSQSIHSRRSTRACR
jgi:hypothetical protein